MKKVAITFASLLLVAHAPFALAQASCSSDGAPQPVTVFERFINADCEACWGDAATPAPSSSSGTVVLDWIVPAASGDQAPLSAVATNDALVRLAALGRKVPTTTDVHVTSVEPSAVATAAPAAATGAGKLRVAHGLPFNDYIGTAISWAPARPTKAQGKPYPASQGNLIYHLLLVESVPAGTEGTAVPRHIVRNLLEGAWTPAELRSQAKARPHWMEVRPMQIPEGAQAERLRMVGWVSDAQGRTVAAAQSVCR
ncbi:MAG: hypothetical protein K2Q97_17005 [Burkholderiaceae bacterium]|nr:hypothetical protein [Burkholderiaceae bacterium]